MTGHFAESPFRYSILAKGRLPTEYLFNPPAAVLLLPNNFNIPTSGIPSVTISSVVFSRTPLQESFAVINHYITYGYRCTL
jgi:hypothetical protein